VRCKLGKFVEDRPDSAEMIRFDAVFRVRDIITTERVQGVPADERDTKRSMLLRLASEERLDTLIKKADGEVGRASVI
jgi:hypothetical protein